MKQEPSKAKVHTFTGLRDILNTMSSTSATITLDIGSVFASSAATTSNLYTGPITLRYVDAPHFVDAPQWGQDIMQPETEWK